MKRLLLILICIQIAITTTLGQSTKGEPQIPVYPTLKNKESFSMIMIPDPQSYVKFAANQPLFELQTAYAGAMLNIDTFNQPGVEEGKKATFALLGKAGYDAKKAELDSLPEKNANYII